VGAILLLAVTFGLMYALLIRPQQKRVREQQALVRETEVGDEVMTSSGIYGIVTELEDDTLLIEVAEGIEMRMARGAVSRILTKGAAPTTGPSTATSTGKSGGKSTEKSTEKNTEENTGKSTDKSGSADEHGEPSDADDAHDNS
jgi:preprotein translocase subunit YajC